MKKLIIIIFSILAVLFGTIAILGMETKYLYRNIQVSDNSNILLLANQNFNIKINALPDSENEDSVNVILIFDKVKSPIKVESAIVGLTNNVNSKLQAKEVTATDGFYSGDKKRNGSANSFENLSENLRIIDKDMKAYYTYAWAFFGDSEHFNLIEIQVSLIVLDVEGRRFKINKTLKMEKSKEIIFRNPIRFH